VIPLLCIVWHNPKALPKKKNYNDKITSVLDDDIGKNFLCELSNQNVN